MDGAGTASTVRSCPRGGRHGAAGAAHGRTTAAPRGHRRRRFGGLFAARLLKRAAVQVTLIDRENYHLFQPLLYQLATGILSEGEVAPPIRHILRKQSNVEVEFATVTGFDLQARTVIARRLDGSERTHRFDSL